MCYLHFIFYIMTYFCLMKNSRGKLLPCASCFVLREVDALLIELLPEMDSDGFKIRILCERENLVPKKGTQEGR